MEEDPTTHAGVGPQPLVLATSIRPADFHAQQTCQHATAHSPQSPTSTLLCGRSSSQYYLAPALLKPNQAPRAETQGARKEKDGVFGRRRRGICCDLTPTSPQCRPCPLNNGVNSHSNSTYLNPGSWIGPSNNTTTNNGQRER